MVTIWVMLLATVWVGYVMLTRWYYLKQRRFAEELRRRELGSSFTESEDDRMSDRREALNERIARMKGEH